MKRKRCNRCGKLKSLDDFYFSHFAKKDKTIRKKSKCKKCCVVVAEEWYAKNPEKRKKAQKRRRDKRSEEQIVACALVKSKCEAKKKAHIPCLASASEIIAAKTGKCFICGVDEEDCTTKLHMDHDHETGEFRGWLCLSCNRALGFFHDSPSALLAAYEYLVKPISQRG